LAMSGLPLEADITRQGRHVRFVPAADISVKPFLAARNDVR
jgi:hypothetical protein